MKIRGVIRTIQDSGVLADLTDVIAHHGIDLEYFMARIETDAAGIREHGVIEAGGTLRGTNGQPQRTFEERRILLVTDLGVLGTVLDQKWFRP